MLLCVVLTIFCIMDKIDIEKANFDYQAPEFEDLGELIDPTSININCKCNDFIAGNQHRDGDLYCLLSRY